MAHDHQIRWFVWVPAGVRDPAQAEGIFGAHPHCCAYYGRNERRWVSDPDLFAEVFLGEGGPKMELDRADAEAVAARFGTTLPDLTRAPYPARLDEAVT